MGALTHNGDVLQGLPADASQINFNKAGTDLDSTQVENAIKEVNTKVNTNANDIDQLKSGLKSGITGNFPVSYVQGWQIIKHIAFDAPFDTLPAVLVQSLFTGGTNGDVYEPANITVNGFDISMYSPIVGSFDYFNFSWLATTT